MTIDPEKFKLVPLSSVSNAEWNAWANQLSDITPHHSAEMLRYYDAFAVDTESHGKSFAVFDSSSQLIALCPFATHRVERGGKQWLEASFSGAPLPFPALAMASTNERRRIARDVFGLMEDRCRSVCVQRIVLRRHAVNLRTAKDSRPIYALEAVDNGFLAFPEPTFYADLRQGEDVLFSQMTGEHRKRIRQTMRKGLRVQTYRSTDPNCTEAEIRQRFAEYRQAHFLSAGRNTRPELTWQLMLTYLLEGHATLYLTFLADQAISFLYCGEFSGLAVGWSQANLEAYEREYSPRHLLEWEAIRDYRTRGFLFYTIGTRYCHPQLHHVPSSKEISIGNFKERYGVEPWPDYIFEKYFDLSLQDYILSERYGAFRQAQALALNPSAPVSDSMTP